MEPTCHSKERSLRGIRLNGATYPLDPPVGACGPDAHFPSVPGDPRPSSAWRAACC